MKYHEKRDLINSLAQSLGVHNIPTTEPGVARYDSTTGTLYCEGITLPHSSLEDIKAWYKQQMEIYRRTCNESSGHMEMYMRYAVAYNSIVLLEDNIHRKETNNQR